LAGIYLHIPFCKQACYYCDFHFSTSLQYIEGVIEAMVTEIKIQKNYLHGERINTIYFGGGTPSLVGPHNLDQLLNSIYRFHAVSADAEITVEVNPDDLHRDQAAALRAMGVNRLSIGIQSFHDRHLRMLHRAHNAKDAVKAFNTARKAGFGNISADLMLGLPQSSLADLQQDLQQMHSLGPEHISVYALTIEPRTVFGNWMRKGKLHVPDDDFSAEQFTATMDFLRKSGYEHYEISNYACPGFRSQHNTAYWNHSRYLGIGPGAHTFDGRMRQYNIANNHLYVKALREDKIPATVEQLTDVQLANEYILLSLRTSDGFDAGLLERRYNMSLTDDQMAHIDKYIETGCLQRRGTALICTDKGKLIADAITVDLCFG
jgi:oxygen-independent coproporphyrinogen-3 oxidase